MNYGKLLSIGQVARRFSSLSLQSPNLLKQQHLTKLDSSAQSFRFLSSSHTLSTFRNVNEDKHPFPTPRRWSLYNEVVREPASPEEPTKRRASFHYVRDNVKYSPKKMWYICCLIRGLSVEEAVKQLSFINSKGAQLAKEMLLEAQQQAVDEHGFEFKSNMFIAECFTGKGLVVKGVRKHAFFRRGLIRYFHHHFFVKLVEGEAPRPFYPEMNPTTSKAKLDKYFKDLEERKIEHTI